MAGIVGRLLRKGHRPERHGDAMALGSPTALRQRDAGVRVILRPHYQAAKLAPRLIEGLVARFESNPRFRHVDQMAESDSLLESDLLVCDRSAMAIEYVLAFGQPVLFVDVPP